MSEPCELDEHQVMPLTKPIAISVMRKNAAAGADENDWRHHISQANKPQELHDNHVMPSRKPMMTSLMQENAASRHR